MGCLVSWLVGVVSVLITVWLTRQIGLMLEWPHGLWGVVIFVPVLALVNAVVGTALRLMSMPISCITLGLFGFVINAIVFAIAGWATGAQMTFLSALFGSVMVTVIAGFLNRYVRRD